MLMLMLMPMSIMRVVTPMLLLDASDVDAYAVVADANANAKTPMQKCRMLLAILMVPMLLGYYHRCCRC